jgi:hypothetical protein
MWHATCTQGNQGDFKLLMVKNQTANLIPEPSFGHNLYFKNPNECGDSLPHILLHSQEHEM